MSLQDLGALGELIGAVAVVATLIYLAIQLRLNAQMNRALIRQSLSDALRSVSAAGIEDESFSHLIYKVDLFSEGGDRGNLTDEELSRFYRFVFQIFRVYENIYLQYREGLYDEPEWNRIRRSINHFVGLPTVDMKALWERMKFAFDDAFVTQVNEISGWGT